MNKVEGCSNSDLILTLYTRTAQGSWLPPVGRFTNIPCGFEPLVDESSTRAVLLCEVCAIKNGVIDRPLVMVASVT